MRPAFAGSPGWHKQERSQFLREPGATCSTVECGHVHWDRPLATLSTGVQLLDVDGRAVLLERAG